MVAPELMTVYARNSATEAFEKTMTDEITKVYASLLMETLSVEANELLLKTLNRADIHGSAGLTVGSTSYFIVSGNFPATEMTLRGFVSNFSMPSPDPETDPFRVELAKRRIAYATALFHGYFIDGNGQVLVPDETIHLPDAIKTEDAVMTVAESEWMEAKDFFGEVIVRLGNERLTSKAPAP